MKTATRQPQCTPQILIIGSSAESGANRFTPLARLAFAAPNSTMKRSTARPKSVQYAHRKAVPVAASDPFGDDALEWGWLG